MTLPKHPFLQAFPFVSQTAAFALLRIVTATLFVAHAIVRITLGTIPQFAVFMESVGFPNGVAWVWAITLAEIVSAALLIANRFVRVAATILFIIAGTGIFLIHRHQGWFVGEHGTGGSEYSVSLMVALIVIAANDRATSFFKVGSGNN